jgi:hypothetical protein
MCLLTIYRLPFQVSGRVSDGLILDSFSQKSLVKRSVRIANCLRACARVFAIQWSQLRTFKNGPTKPITDSFRNRHLLPENSLEAYFIKNPASTLRPRPEVRKRLYEDPRSSSPHKACRFGYFPDRASRFPV